MTKMTIKEALQNRKSPDIDLRRQAASFILNNAHEEHVPDLIDALKTIDPHSGEIIIAVLMGIQREENLNHPELLTVLKQFIETTLNPIAQADAIGILTDMYWQTKDDVIFNTFLDMLSCEHEGVREGIADSLAELGDARAVEPLIKLLHSENLSVISGALEALSHFKDNRAVQHIIPLLKKGRGIKSGDGIYMRITLAELAAGELKEYDSAEARDAIKKWNMEQTNDNTQNP